MRPAQSSQTEVPFQLRHRRADPATLDCRSRQPRPQVPSLGLSPDAVDVKHLDALAVVARLPLDFCQRVISDAGEPGGGDAAMLTVGFESAGIQSGALDAVRFGAPR